MNKRQRKKQEKKQRAELLAGIIELSTIEVGDTVEIVANSYNGHEVGTKGLVIKDDGCDDFEVSKRMDMHDYLAMIHHVRDLKLIRKGTNQ